MNALRCEMCGGKDLVKQDGVFVCQHCGVKYSVEEAKKMMVEGTVDIKGTVKVDTSDELKNLYEIARRAKDADNYDSASKYYDMILVKDPSSWEANYYVVYFKSMGCKIAQIWSAGTDMANCQSSVLNLIHDNVLDEAEQQKAIEEVLSRNLNISSMLFIAAKNHYEEIDAQIQSNFLQDYINNAIAATTIMYTFSDELEKIFGEKYSSACVKGWAAGINIHKEFVKYLADKHTHISLINSYGDKIRKYDSSYVNPEVNTSQCYVATSIYGSYDCPAVWTLRRFRDFTLDETFFGRLFIKSYYAISPSFVKWFGNTIWFKSIFKPVLDKMVSILQKNGVESTPYQDKY